jgi:alpha-beta hydrolase superfamily lysophospholipase
MYRLTSHWVSQHNSNSTRYFVREWRPEQEPIGVIHILHGMMEHSGNYHDIATQFTHLGWAVVAHDHPSAGLSMSPFTQPDHLPNNGVELLVHATAYMDQWIRKKYTNLPLVRYAHSMGSFIALNATLNNTQSDGLILTGFTCEPTWRLTIQKGLLHLLSICFGPSKPAHIAHAITFAPLNKPFTPKYSGYAWITRNIEKLKHYNMDPLCGNVASWGFFKVLTQLLINMNSIKKTALPPTLILSGEFDTLSNYGKKVTRFIKKQKGANIQHHVIPEARHKIEGDPNQDQAIKIMQTMLQSIKK